MKTNQLIRILWLTGLIFFSINAFSQNVIFTRNGDKIQVGKYKFAVENKVKLLKYKTTDNPKSGFQKIDLSEIYYIKNKKGNGLAYHEKGRGYKIKKVDNLSEIELRGAIDACKYFNGSGPMLGTFVPSFLFMPVGLGTAIVVSSVKPKKTLNMPMNEFVNDPVYVQSYKKQAHKNKQGVTWLGFTVGFSLGLTIAVLVSAL